MSLWLAVLLALVGTSLMNVGIVLMKKGAVETSAALGRPTGALAAYVRSDRAWAGWGLNIGGAGLFLVALGSRSAPISFLQPLATFGLVVNALMAVFYLGEGYGLAEWLGVSLLFVGVVFVGELHAF